MSLLTNRSHGLTEYAANTRDKAGLILRQPIVVSVNRNIFRMEAVYEFV